MLYRTAEGRLASVAVNRAMPLGFASLSVPSLLFTFSILILFFFYSYFFPPPFVKFPLAEMIAGRVTPRGGATVVNSRVAESARARARSRNYPDYPSSLICMYIYIHIYIHIPI